MLYSILNGGVSFSEVIIELLASLLVVMVVLPFHELAHGFVAYKLGDNTAKIQGRLTLNPLSHLDYLGAACIILIGFGWAKPVPVNPRNFKNPKKDMALVALAGPMANLLAALVGALLYVATLTFAAYLPNGLVAFVMTFFVYYVSVNIGLAVFNLIPLPPLDGSKILGAFLSDRNYIKMMVNEKKLNLLLLILIATNIIDKIVLYPRALLELLIYAVAALPFKFF